VSIARGAPTLPGRLGATRGDADGERAIGRGITGLRAARES
jgi:hypothetical protein